MLPMLLMLTLPCVRIPLPFVARRRVLWLAILVQGKKGKKKAANKCKVAVVRSLHYLLYQYEVELLRMSILFAFALCSYPTGIIVLLALLYGYRTMQTSSSAFYFQTL